MGEWFCLKDLKWHDAKVDPFSYEMANIVFIFIARGVTVCSALSECTVTRAVLLGSGPS